MSTKLYELTNDFNDIFDRLDDLYDLDLSDEADPEAARNELLENWFLTLDAIEGEFESKAENIGVFIKNLKADEAALSEEKRCIDARLKAKRNAIERLSSYLLGEMEAMHRKKIDRPKALISVNAGRESVKISDENAFIAWAEEHDKNLLTYRKPDISKTGVKNAMASGEKLPYASITKTPYITVK